MSKPVKQLRQFDRVKPTPLWSAIEARDPGPELPPPVPPARRALVIAAALAIFAVAGVFAWEAFRPATTSVGSSPPTPPPGMSVYTDPLGWTAFYPSGWSVIAQPHTSDGLGAGVLIANHSPQEKTPVNDLVDLSVIHPLDAVPDPSGASSTFPLAANDFKVDPGPEDTSSFEFTIEGVRYNAILQVGSAASGADVAAMDGVIASISPPSSSADRSSAPGSPLIATLDAPADGSIPSLTLAYGNEQRDFIAEGGHWPGVKGFVQPGLSFPIQLPPGTVLQIEGDASSVTGKLEVLDQNHQSTGEMLPLDLQGGSATLAVYAPSYQLDLTGAWPQGTAEFFVVIDVEQPSGPTASFTTTGDALAEELGLQEVKGLSASNPVDVTWCKTGVGETPDGRAFCMDNALDPNDPNLTVDAWTLGRMLAGHQVTAQERAQFEQNVSSQATP